MSNVNRKQQIYLTNSGSLLILLGEQQAINMSGSIPSWWWFIPPRANCSCQIFSQIISAGIIFWRIFLLNRTMKTLEHDEQVSLIKWWSLACRSFGIDQKLLFAIPNGGERNVIVASRLKAEGVRAGVPDLFLAHPNNEFHGLFIEMKKAKGGVVSDNQKCYLNLLQNNGYEVAVCHGWIEAKQIIERYLNAK